MEDRSLQDIQRSRREVLFRLDSHTQLLFLSSERNSRAIMNRKKIENGRTLY